MALKSGTSLERGAERSKIKRVVVDGWIVEEAGALPHFRWVIDHGTRSVYEYFVSTAHYRRLTAR